jgi:hypothetical protein
MGTDMRSREICHSILKGCAAVMARKATTSRQRVTCPARVGPRSVRDIEDAVDSIVRSDEPAVVLSSLARASYPAFSDACAVELSEGADALLQVSRRP